MIRSVKFLSKHGIIRYLNKNFNFGDIFAVRLLIACFFRYYQIDIWFIPDDHVFHDNKCAFVYLNVTDFT